MLDTLLKLKNSCLSLLSWICVAIFSFMTILGFYQIVTRYIFNSPSTISEELLTYSFTWLALFSATRVFGLRDHMRMSFFADKFFHRFSKGLALFSETLVFFFSLIVLLFGGISITKLTLSQTTASLGVSMGTVYVVLPVCGVLICLFSVLNILFILRGREKA